MILLKKTIILIVFTMLACCTQKNNLIVYEKFKKGNEKLNTSDKLSCNKNKQIEIWFKESTSLYHRKYDTTNLNTITKEIAKLLPTKKYKAYPESIEEYITKKGKCISGLFASVYSQEDYSMNYRIYVAFINDSISDIKIFDYYEKKDKVKKSSTISILKHRKKGIFIETDYFKDCITDEDSDKPLHYQLIGFYLKSTIWKLDETTGKFIFLGNVNETVNIPEGLIAP